jgi:hypothetical protein
MNSQLLLHLPTEIARRFRDAIPPRQRSAYVCKLLEQNLPNVDEHMYQLGLQAQAFDSAHPEESNELEFTLTDGLDPNESFDTAKLFALCQK